MSNLINILSLIKESLVREKPTVLDSLQTLYEIKEKHLSISRYGDGEFLLMQGRSIAFQEANPQLIESLKNIVRQDDILANHVVGIPLVMSSYEGFTEESKYFWVNYLSRNRKKINQYLDFSCRYYDSQISRFWINRVSEEYSQKLLDTWRQIWGNCKVLVVEGKSSRFGSGNDLFNGVKDIKRILCPEKNAYAYYGEIKQIVSEKAREYDLVLLALGPTATVLAYDLSREGVWAIDSGNLDMEYEWFLKKTKQKVVIPGKYSHEVAGGTNVSPIADEKYSDQIIAIIGQ